MSERLWNGISLVRVNLGTTIVGTPSQVADELFRYWGPSIDEFILPGFPHVEECDHVVNTVLPLLREQLKITLNNQPQLIGKVLRSERKQQWQTSKSRSPTV